jgi:hypothetical protein
MKRPTENDLQLNNKRAKGTVDSLVRGQADDFVLLLTKIKVEQLGGGPIAGTRCSPHSPSVAHRTETLPHLFQALIENNILSVPVLNQSGKYFGFVDYRDIVSYVCCDVFSDLTKTELDVEKLFDSVGLASSLLIRQEAKFSSTTVQDIVLYRNEKRSPAHLVAKGISLFSAWEILAWEGLHRIHIIGTSRSI